MFYSLDRYAFPLTQRVPVEYNGEVLRVYTHGVHPGYARLIDENSGEQLTNLVDISQLAAFYEVHGPSRRHLKSSDIKSASKHSAIEGNIYNNIVPTQDQVHSVHSPYWPVEASEWITRTRRHACPSKSAIEQVVRYGCNFVGVAHKLSCYRENGNEWRFHSQWQNCSSFAARRAHRESPIGCSDLYTR